MFIGLPGPARDGRAVFLCTVAAGTRHQMLIIQVKHG